MARRKGISQAAALRYQEVTDPAPVVVASGKGVLADRIVEIAREAQIPVVEDAALVSALLALELGEEIPPELYQAVARVLVFVYDLDRKSEVLKR